MSLLKCNWFKFILGISYEKSFFVRFLALLVAIGLLFSCNLFQDEDPVFPSYGTIEGFTYSSAQNGNLALLKSKNVNALGKYKRTFKLYIKRKIKEKLGQAVEFDKQLTALNAKESVAVGVNFDQTIKEPAISREHIKRVITCPLPNNLDTQGKTLLKAIDWKIFATCELKSWNLIDLSDELGEGEEQPFFKAYPPIEAANSYSDAFEFVSVSVLNSLYQNHSTNAGADEKLGFFERVFLVTKFRTLTQLEKSSVEELIKKRGLFLTLKNYLLNWYLSDFYGQHFDYSQNHDGRYRMTRLWGIVRNEQSYSARGARYQIIDSNIKGHVLSGTVSAMKRLKKQRMLLPEEEERYMSHISFDNYDAYRRSKFTYNMEFQFYLPIDKFKRKKKKGKITDATITPNPTVTIMVEKPNSVPIKTVVALKHRFTHPDFPNPDFTNNVFINFPTVDSIELEISRIELQTMSDRLISPSGFPTSVRLTNNISSFQHLLGSAKIPAGIYKQIKIFFGTKNKKTVKSITTTDRTTSNLAFYLNNRQPLILKGMLILRGGLVSELVLGTMNEKITMLPVLVQVNSDILLHPNVSVPVYSIKSMNSIQDRKVREVLGDDLNDMINEADIILQGRALSARVAFANDYYGRSQVYTFYRIRGNVPIKGSFTKQKYNNFTLQVIGGRVPGSDIEILVTHMPKLTIGKDTVLFLKHYADKMGVLQGDRGQIDL